MASATRVSNRQGRSELMELIESIHNIYEIEHEGDLKETCRRLSRHPKVLRVMVLERRFEAEYAVVSVSHKFAQTADVDTLIDEII
jgi:hypothetical protein